MKCVVVIGYNRPRYFEKVLESLEKNPESQNLPFFFFLDGGPESRQAEYNEIIEKRKFPLKTVINRDRNLGCGLNIINAREHVFDRLGFDAAMIFEDDMIVSPHYIGLGFRLLRQFPDDCVQCWSKCIQTREWKMERLGQVSTGKFHFWGYALGRATWDRISPILKEYRSKFLVGPYNQRNSEGIRKWFGTLVENPPHATGQDAATEMALQAQGIKRIVTIVNRGKYIGEEGIHQKARIFKRMGFDQVNLDIFPEDREIKEFYFGNKSDIKLEKK